MSTEERVEETTKVLTESEDNNQNIVLEEPQEGDEEKAAETAKPEVQPIKERFYDQIPLTYKQVDIITKALVIILVVILVIAIKDAM